MAGQVEIFRNSPQGAAPWRARLWAAGLGLAVLAACQPGSDAGAPTVEAAPDGAVRLVDRDVEAPEVYQTTDSALWDGRPSLGGVWVAAPNAADPQRVIMRNTANGKFVIGALFKREVFNPGPKLQISSDAANALGVLAGEPVELQVTALKRVGADTAANTGADAKPALDANITLPGEAKPSDPKKTAKAATTSTTTTDTAAIAAQAIDRAAGAKPAPAQPGATPSAAPAATTGALRVQIGLFSVEENATRAVNRLKEAGIAAAVQREETQGKVFWNVTATGAGDGAALLAQIKGLGFTDAYLTRR